MVRYPAISLWQPWGSLWACSPRLKLNETRHWPAPARYIGQRVLVHAAKTREGIRDAQEDPDLAFLCAERFGDDWATSLPLGGFIGSVIMRESVRIAGDETAKTSADLACGNWAPGRWAWPGDDPHVFPMVAARGQQGFWTAEVDERACW